MCVLGLSLDPKGPALMQSHSEQVQGYSDQDKGVRVVACVGGQLCFIELQSFSSAALLLSWFSGGEEEKVGVVCGRRVRHASRHQMNDWLDADRAKGKCRSCRHVAESRSRNTHPYRKAPRRGST